MAKRLFTLKNAPLNYTAVLIDITSHLQQYQSMYNAVPCISEKKLIPSTTARNIN